MSLDEVNNDRPRSSPNSTGHGVAQGQRNRVIDEFVKDFTDWDWLYFRSKLRQAEVGFQLANFSNLPVDVLPLIAAHLTLSEAFSCRLVSRQWKELWSDDIVSRGLLQRHFPGAIQCWGASTSIGALLTRLTRQHSKPVGEDWAVSKITWNVGTDAVSSTARQGVVSTTPPSGMNSCPLQFMYAAGKVAWQAFPSFIVIDDFAAGTWHRVSFLSNRLYGMYSTLVGFSGTLLIVGHTDNAPEDQGPRSSCRKLIVHHVESNSQKPITLPNNLTKCCIHDDRVVFITRGPEVYFYEWGGMLKQLELRFDETAVLTPTSRHLLTSALFHPLHPKTIFIVSAIFPEEVAMTEALSPAGARTSRRSRALSAHSVAITQYEQGQRVRCQVSALPSPVGEMRCSMANQFGSYCIYEGICSPGRHRTPFLMYNVFTESFYETSIGLRMDSSEPRRPETQRMWNSYLLTYDTTRISGMGDAGYFLSLKATPCMSLAHVPSSTQSHHKHHTREVWQDTAHFEQGSSLHLSHFPRILDVSDDFVVVSYEEGYVVLSADNRQICLRERGGHENGT